MGNVFIADDEVAMENSNGSVILERHGKYVKGKYTLTGGSVGLFEGTCSRGCYKTPKMVSSVRWAVRRHVQCLRVRDLTATKCPFHGEYSRDRE